MRERPTLEKLDDRRGRWTEDSVEDVPGVGGISTDENGAIDMPWFAMVMPDAAMADTSPLLPVGLRLGESDAEDAAGDVAGCTGVPLLEDLRRQERFFLDEGVLLPTELTDTASELSGMRKLDATFGTVALAARLRLDGLDWMIAGGDSETGDVVKTPSSVTVTLGVYEGTEAERSCRLCDCLRDGSSLAASAATRSLVLLDLRDGARLGSSGVGRRDLSSTIVAERGWLGDLISEPCAFSRRFPVDRECDKDPWSAPWSANDVRPAGVGVTRPSSSCGDGAPRAKGAGEFRLDSDGTLFADPFALLLLSWAGEWAGGRADLGVFSSVREFWLTLRGEGGTTVTLGPERSEAPSSEGVALPVVVCRLGRAPSGLVGLVVLTAMVGYRFAGDGDGERDSPGETG